MFLRPWVVGGLPGRALFQAEVTASALNGTSAAPQFLGHFRPGIFVLLQKVLEALIILWRPGILALTGKGDSINFSLLGYPLRFCAEGQRLQF